MATDVYFDLEVYNRAGTAVEFTLSSDPVAALPFLGTKAHPEPIGDGQEFDPLTGEIRASQWIGRIADSITSGTSRVMTSRLEDANYRQQLMRRKAILKKRTGGSTVVMCPGLLTRLSLVGPAEFDYQVTDRTKVRSDVKLFAPRSATIVLTAGAAAGATSYACEALSIGLPKNTILNFGAGKTAIVATAAAASATSVSVTGKAADGVTTSLAVSSGDQATYREGVADFIARWPNRGCAFGGPVIGGFLDQPDRGGWQMRIEKLSTGAGPLLRFMRGYGPRNFAASKTDVNDPAIAKATNDRVGPWTGRGGTAPDGSSMVVTSAITTFDQAEKSGFAHDLMVEVLNAAGSSSYGYFQPGIFAIVGGDDATVQLVQYGHNGDGGRPKFSPGVWLRQMTSAQYAANGLPTLGSDVRARALTANVSEISPIYHTAHPVDWVALILTELGYSYEAASATSLKETMGAKLQYSERITAPKAASPYLTSTFLGPFGIGLRMKDNGDLQFFSARIFSNSPPATEITSADVVREEDAPAGPIFDITEQTAIAQVVVECKELKSTRGDGSVDAQADMPTDGIFERSIRIERKNGDPGAVGDRVHSWSLAGMVHQVGTYKADLGYWDVAIREVFDRWGRGVIEAGLALLRGGSGDSANIGDEIIVTVPQLPNKNKRYGDDPTVGGRAMQIVRLTKQIWGALAKVIDSGVNAQPYATAPTISIAASADYPKTVAMLTITNAAALNALGVGAQVRMATVAAGAGDPASTDYLDVISFEPGKIPTAAFALPDTIVNRKVFAKARSLYPSNRPSSYSSPSSVTLSSYTAPSGLGATPDVTDGRATTLAWTAGESTLKTDVFLRLQSETASSNVLIEALSPGATKYVFSTLKPGIAYTASIQHRDPVTGDLSALVTVNFTTASLIPVLTVPTDVIGFAGVQDAALGILTEAASYGVTCKVADSPMDVEAHEAVETGVGAGTYGSYAFMARAAARQGTYTPLVSKAPNDGLRRSIKVREVKPTHDVRDCIAAWSVAELAALTVAEAAALSAYAVVSDFSSAVIVEPWANRAVQKKTKTMRIHAADFFPAYNTTTEIGFGTGEVYIQPAATTANAFAPIRLPAGVRVVGGRYRWTSIEGGSVTVAVTSAIDSSGTNLVIDSDVAFSGGYVTRTLSFTETIDPTKSYFVQLQLTSVGAGGITRFSWLELDYEAGFLDQSL